MQSITLITGMPGAGKTSLAGVLSGIKFLPEHGMTVQRVAKIHGCTEAQALEKILDGESSFLWELPLNDQGIVQLRRAGEKHPCNITAHFVGVEDWSFALGRLIAREKIDKSNRPLHNVINETMSYLSYLKELLPLVSRIHFFDNTRSFRAVGTYCDGKIQLAEGEEIPQWMAAIKDEFDPKVEPVKPTLINAKWGDQLFGYAKASGEVK